MHFTETILTSGSGSLTFHDIQTGVPLTSFKGSNASIHCTTHLESTSSQGGLLLSAQQDKGVLNVWNYQKDQIALKIVLPEKLTCLSMDSRGQFCAGGTAQGRIYLWETASGILFNTWDAHYRAVTVLRFTGDGNALISGSDDSGVSVWSVASLIDVEEQNTLPIPLSTLSDHTLPITDIVCGLGLYPNCRLLTSSIDCSVKLWDLSAPPTSALLTTFQFPSPISSLAFDAAERFFFAGSQPTKDGSSGVVYRMDLFTKKSLGIANGNSGEVLNAIGGMGSLDIIRMGLEDEEGKRRISISEPVTALVISLTGSLLLVGTSIGLIHVYDIPSSQRLRTISSHKGTPITYLKTLPKPLDLIGHVSLSLIPPSSSSADGIKDIVPTKPILPFQRIKDSKAREAHEISVLLPSKDVWSIVEEDEQYYAGSEEMLQDYAFFVGSGSPMNGTATEVADTRKVGETRVKELEQEVEYLRKQLGKAKGINDAMWEGVVRDVVNRRQQGDGKESEIDVAV
ncbi:WD40-repeat-containing domain protein [Flagelloscypha sp. PMI_526]|nr:WD40-repeat-containing domain protein [Flagelloscypha sp. PMI_526]